LSEGEFLPAIVDHEERRVAIAVAAGILIAERGCDGITLRDVARKAGYSPSIIGHYFENKLDLLVYTFEQIRLNMEEAVNALLETTDDPLGCLAELLPLDDKRKRDWLMWYGFWGKSMAEPEIAAARILGHDRANLLIRRIIKKAQAGHIVLLDADIDRITRIAQSMVLGISSLVVHDPGKWTSEQQRELLISQIKLACTK
jgi:AcrR family transcriptional regulator